jgi:hypothetical protein
MRSDKIRSDKIGSDRIGSDQAEYGMRMLVVGALHGRWAGRQACSDRIDHRPKQQLDRVVPPAAATGYGVRCMLRVS